MSVASMRKLKWDYRFTALANLVATWSKDPSTQCGAVIVRPDKTIASLGYNGFPRGMDDSPDLYDNRDTKLSRVIHAEMNALLAATEKLEGCTLYTYPLLPCDRCSVHVIQAGIARVVAPMLHEGTDRWRRWKDSVRNSRYNFLEAGVEVLELTTSLEQEFPRG